jgi:hypothetical protein
MSNWENGIFMSAALTKGLAHNTISVSEEMNVSRMGRCEVLGVLRSAYCSPHASLEVVRGPQPHLPVVHPFITYLSIYPSPICPPIHPLYNHSSPIHPSTHGYPSKQRRQDIVYVSIFSHGGDKLEGKTDMK